MIDIPIEYLLDRSRAGLRELLTKRLNASANLRKRLEQIERELIESCAEEMFLEWLAERGEELVLLAAEPRPVTPREEASDAPKPLKPLYRYDFWRSEQRHARRSRR